MPLQPATLVDPVCARQTFNPPADNVTLDTPTSPPKNHAVSTPKDDPFSAPKNHAVSTPNGIHWSHFTASLFLEHWIRVLNSLRD
ncbi:unnamed protein product [Boreogadus saida]